MFDFLFRKNWYESFKKQCIEVPKNQLMLNWYALVLKTFLCPENAQ